MANHAQWQRTPVLRPNPEGPAGPLGQVDRVAIVLAGRQPGHKSRATLDGGLSMDDVVGLVTTTLRLSRRRRDAIARELETHLEDARRDLELAGWRAEDAEREA